MIFCFLSSEVYREPPTRGDYPRREKNKKGLKGQSDFASILKKDEKLRGRYTPSGRSPVYPTKQATKYYFKRRRKIL